MSKNTLFLIVYPTSLHLYFREEGEGNRWKNSSCNFDIKHPIDLQVSNALQTLPEETIENCHSIKIIHQNLINTWVPKDFFSEEHLEDYLKYNAKSFKIEYLAADEINHLNIFNVYGFHPQFHEYLDTRFSETSVHHFDTLLLSLLGKWHLKNPKDLYAFIQDKHLFIAVFSHTNTPSFINHFDIETKEDALYYLLFVMEQLKIIAQEADILLLGDTSWKSFLETYIKQISTLDPSDDASIIHQMLLES